MRWSACLFCLALTAAPLSAADELDGPVDPKPPELQLPEDQPVEQRPVDVKPTRRDAAPRAIANTKMLERLRSFAEGRKLALTEVGSGPVRLIGVGGGTLPASALDKAATALAGLEQWCGATGAFLPRQPQDSDVYWLAVFKKDEDFKAFCTAWVEAQDPKPADTKKSVDRLVKDKDGFGSSRVTFARQTDIEKMTAGWAVYAAVGSAVDQFYAARGGRAPAWIREGLAADLQLAVTNSIAVISITNQQGKEKPATTGWGREVAKIHAKGKEAGAATAVEITRGSTSFITLPIYYQYWSLNTFVRSQCGGAGEKHAWFRIMDLTARGGESYEVLDEVLRAKDPALTTAWVGWAATQKR